MYVLLFHSSTSSFLFYDLHLVCCVLSLLSLRFVIICNIGAYRAHMYNVQKDLQALRQEVIEKENALASNDKIQKLEEECEWYRKESLRLDSLLTQSKKKEDFLRDKTQMLEDDRDWLAKQLKSAKKQNKLLRAELELQLREGTDANEDMFRGQTQQQLQNSASAISLPALQYQQGPETNTPQGMNKSKSAATFASPNSAGTNRFADKTSTAAFRKELRDVKLERDKERKAANTLRARITSEKNERKELEDFFVDCVDDVKKQIDRRRRNVVGGTLGGRLTEKQEFALASETTLDDFLAADRQRVVEMMLGRDDVLAMLYDRIFPEGGGGGGGGEGSISRGGVREGGESMESETVDLEELLRQSKRLIAEVPQQDYSAPAAGHY
jgi:hypothetical protein